MNYHTITYPDQNNGDGLRVCLWLSGCNHHCKGCHNPQTWSPDSGILFDENAKKELFEELGKDYISGITFTGGDPLHENNIQEVLTLINEIKDKYPEKTIWLYTGYSWDEIWFPYDELITNHSQARFTRYVTIKDIDVLVEGKYKEDLRDVTLKWRGSSNQRVINVQESIRQNKIVLHCD